MGADYKVYLTFFQTGQDFALLSGTAETAEYLHLKREVFKALFQSIIVLICQYGSRNQHCRLFAVCHAFEQCTGCDLSLAEAHITAEQSVHGERLFHISFDFLY